MSSQKQMGEMSLQAKRPTAAHSAKAAIQSIPQSSCARAGQQHVFTNSDSRGFLPDSDVSVT